MSENYLKTITSHKKWYRMIALLVVLSMLLPSSAFVAEAQETVSVQAQGTEKQIKNIIYMIPDGGGFGLFDMADEVKKAGGFTKEQYGTLSSQNSMYMKDFLAGTVATKSLSDEVTDSAAAGTALAIGYKTYNNYVGVDEKKLPRASILEAAKLEGKATGIVVTKNYFDATPGAFTAHTSSRSYEEGIAWQTFYQNIDIVLGVTSGTVSNSLVRDAGYTLISSKSALENSVKNATKDTKLWTDMYFNGTQQFPYDIKYEKDNDTPTLLDMTKASISILEKKENGFFLMVEGSTVDVAGHAADARYTSSEYIAFDEAFKYAVEWAKQRDDTIVVAVPDHDTGALTVPTGNSLTNAVNQILNKQKPSLTWQVLGDVQQHSNQNVGVWIYAPSGIALPKGVSSTIGDTQANRTNYLIDNTDIAPYLMSQISNQTLDEVTNQLYIDVGKYGTYNTSTEIFTFSQGSATIKRNQSVASINGASFDLGGRIAIYVGGKFYVPKNLTDALGLSIEIVDPEQMKGDGSKNNPYLIENAGNFIAFTNALKGDGSGKKEGYAGKYFKQTANIDLSSISNYEGVGATETFYGIYDGQGYKIKVNINSSSTNGTSIFPYIESGGIVMNLGTEGCITNTGGSSGCAGIVRSVRAGGKVLNCWSTVDLNALGTYSSTGGVAWTNYGQIQNAYYLGSVKGTYNYGIAQKKNSDGFSETYYRVNNTAEIHGEAGGKNRSTETISNFIQTTGQALQNNRNAVVEKNTSLKLSLEQICEWVTIGDTQLVFKGNAPELKSMYYSYTDIYGNEKIVEIENFTSHKTGYSVEIPSDFDFTKPVKLMGTAFDSENTMTMAEDIKVSTVTRFGSGVIESNSRYQNSYIATEVSKVYAVSFVVAVDPNATATPAVPTGTPEPDVTVTPNVPTGTPNVPTSTPETDVTATPTVPTSTPKTDATATPTVPTSTPKTDVTATPTVPTSTPKTDVTATPTVPTGTPEPDVTAMPNVPTSTPEIGVTATPVVPTGTPEITVTATPIVPTDTPSSVPTEAPIPEASKIPIESCEVTVLDGALQYTGKPITLKMMVRYNGELKEDIDYKLEYVNNTNAGLGMVRILGIGKYSGSRIIYFFIAKASVQNVTVKKITDKEYTGKALKPKVIITYNGMILKEMVDYKLNYSNHKNKGNAVVKITGIGKYNGIITKTFQIKAKAINKLKFSKISRKTYTGKAIRPKVTVKFGNKKLKKGKDYTLTYKNNKMKGRATIIIKGKGNYRRTKKITFLIE